MQWHNLQRSEACLHVEKVIDKNRKSNVHAHDPAQEKKKKKTVNKKGSREKW